MRTDQRPGLWVTLVGVGTGLGWALHCQVPPSHVRVGMGEDCATCHQSDFQRAEQPLHVGVISENCAECHSNERWSPARGSDHSWPLEGAHAVAACDACHLGEPAVYEGTPKACVECHGLERDQVLEPSHVDFSDDCSSCHSSTAWAPAAFEHEWPLEGAHAAATCASCHTGDPPVYDGTPETCVGCHQADRDTAVRPSHADFSDDCGSCHSNAAWAPAAFEHEWPLEGAHAVTTCAGCHAGDPPVYDGTPETCVGCHQADRDRAVQPSHADFSDDCGSCHSSAAWAPAAFEHEWPLEGAHASAACGSCHTGDPPVYDGTPETCIGCHQADRASVTQPSHEGFSEDCASCHGTASWDGASFEHTGAFPLTGAHQTTECVACHTGSPAVFAGTASECVACHRADFDASPFPGHADFGTACQDCHTTAGWVPASGGNHPQNRFSITGRHDYACNECHNPSLGPNGAGNADCVGCHEGEHTLGRMDNEHVGEVRNYPTGGNRAPNFCLQCHPDGNE